jgi:hypothetical protein
MNNSQTQSKRFIVGAKAMMQKSECFEEMARISIEQCQDCMGIGCSAMEARIL